MTAGPTASAHAAPLTPPTTPPTNATATVSSPTETRMRRLSFAAAVIRSPVSPPLASPYPTQATPTGTSREAASCHVSPSNADPQSSGRARRHAAQATAMAPSAALIPTRPLTRRLADRAYVRAPSGIAAFTNPVSNVRYGPYSVCAPRTAPMPTVPITGPSTSSDTWPAPVWTRYSRARRGPRSRCRTANERAATDVRAEAQPDQSCDSGDNTPGRPARGERDDRIRRRCHDHEQEAAARDEPDGIHGARLTRTRLREQREAQCVLGEEARQRGADHDEHTTDVASDRQAPHSDGNPAHRSQDDGTPQRGADLPRIRPHALPDRQGLPDEPSHDTQAQGIDHEGDAVGAEGGRVDRPRDHDRRHRVGGARDRLVGDRPRHTARYGSRQPARFHQPPTSTISGSRAVSRCRGSDVPATGVDRAASRRPGGPEERRCADAMRPFAAPRAPSTP